MTLEPIARLMTSARERGVNPALALKAATAEVVLAHLAELSVTAVLQGGGACHFAYGSPRLSVDLDFAGQGSAQAIDHVGGALAARVAGALNCPASWSSKERWPLFRGKITLVTDPSHTLVLPIEACEVPAYSAHQVAGVGLVEEPSEIIADKLVATVLRFRDRGSLKLTDLFDIAYLVRRGAALPGADLLSRKLGDYRASATGLWRVALAQVQPEELGQTLMGVLPAAAAAEVAPHELLRELAAITEGLADAL